ncbi:phosphotransferase [Allokutzneria albata]|uniref:Phosphotransferase enzyme family protein n=1 Tax=Allokutzneria albata TaxID=211114 RepID=A0A1G9XQC1_ALLAB|nr:phosphotransferase [Allokutzneria albata]SDM98974.1 Phosphotransferase enzyme family protein [Allokutzneria albata]
MTVGKRGRIGWADLPARVRAAVEEIVGGPVVEAVSQPGGFSPGTADRVRTASGARAFVKAVSAAQNDFTPHLHRQEARVTAALPPEVPAPRLLGSFDDGDWVALVLEDIEGHLPATPWKPDELERVLDALAAVPTTAQIPDLPKVEEALADEFAGWRRISADPPDDLDPWAARRLETLCELADRGLAATTGDALVHMDIRADNILLGADGAVTVVDWPWSSRGAEWLDRLMLLVNVRLHGGPDTTALLARHTANADPDDVVAVLVGFAGLFLDVARQPPPVGLPTVRAFQRAQGDAVLSWVSELLG